MPTFGQHETDRRLHLSGVGALYTSKSDPKKIVKVLQPPMGIWSDDQIHDEILAFRVRAKTQQAVAKQSKNWAAVHETHMIRVDDLNAETSIPITRAGPANYSATGAYSVLDRYDRSVQSLIDGRVNIHNHDLRNIVTGAIRGLIDLHKFASRPHGNLKPSNILLTDATDLAKATVHLADPAADGALTSNSTGTDLADLGRIIYELVNLRPYQGGTIGPSKEWTRLGPDGENWRKLTSALLDKDAPAEQRDLEQILAKADTWRAEPPKSKLPFIAAAAAMILIIGGITLFFALRPPKLAFDPVAWQNLCISYESWVGNFVENMDAKTQAEFVRPNYPPKIMELFTKSKVDAFDPRHIVDDAGKSYTFLAANPPEAAKTGYAPNHTKESNDFVGALAAALTPEQWPLLKNLDVTAAHYDAAGWKKAAEGIRSVIQKAKPPALPRPTADPQDRLKDLPHSNIISQIQTTVATANMINSIDQNWQQIDVLIKQIPKTDVFLIDHFREYAESVPRSTLTADSPGSLDDVKALAAAFATIQPVATDLVANLNDKNHPLDFDALRADELFVKDTPSLQAYAKLSGILKHGDYIKLNPNPQDALADDKDLADLDNDIQIIKDRNAADEHLAELTLRRKALGDAITSWKGIPAIQKRRADLEKAVAAGRTALAKLHEDGSAWSRRYKITPDEFVALQNTALEKTPATIANASPVILEQWKLAHTALKDYVSTPEAKQRLADWNFLKKMDDTFTGLQTTYASFDKLLPPSAALADVPGEKWRHDIATHVQFDYRAEILKEMMTTPKLKKIDQLPQVDDPDYKQYIAQTRAAYEKTCVEAHRLIDDYTAIEDRFNRLELQPPEWKQLFAAWQGNKFLADTTISTAVQPITTRVNNLLVLEKIGDYKTLADKALSDDAPEIVLTAWRNLGKLAVSQDIPVLDYENNLQKKMIGLLAQQEAAKQITAQQSAAIAAEINNDRPVRWRRWAATLNAALQIQAALSQVEAFGIKELSPTADAAMYYNQILFTTLEAFNQVNKPGAKDDVFQPLGEQFIKRVNTIPDEALRNSKPIKDMFDRITKALRPAAQQEAASSGAGPQLALWEMEKPRDDVRVFYFPSKVKQVFSLEFVRLEGESPVFLCTTEMSVGLFADTVNRNKVLDQLDNSNKPLAGQHWFKITKAADDNWGESGPRSWMISEGKFLVNTTWLWEQVPQMLGHNQPFYPKGLKDNNLPPPPSVNSPMQLVTPWSAMYVARLLGCRLPTSAEWTAAYQRAEVNAPASEPRDAWNLRGAQWLEEQNHAKSMSDYAMPYPDANIFLTDPNLVYKVMSSAATPWTNADLAKLAPTRISNPGPDVYKGSTLWFRNVGQQPGRSAPSTGNGSFHDLVGNVAEYVYDGPGATAVITDKNRKPTTDEIDAKIAAKDSLFAIGGSSLSAPEDVPFYEKKPVDPEYGQTVNGYSDVGFRLAYTAPIDSVKDILADASKSPKYLAGSESKPR